jgi:hypothetical protein
LLIKVIGEFTTKNHVGSCGVIEKVLFENVIIVIEKLIFVRKNYPSNPRVTCKLPFNNDLNLEKEFEDLFEHDEIKDI